MELCSCILERELQSLDIEVLSHQNVENTPDALYDNKHLNKYSGLPIFTQNLGHVIQIYSFSSPGDFRRRKRALKVLNLQSWKDQEQYQSLEFRIKRIMMETDVSYKNSYKNYNILGGIFEMFFSVPY